MPQITVSVDQEDYDAITAAIAARQSWRVNGVPLLPDSDSERAGVILAEVCRGWLAKYGPLKITDDDNEGEEWKGGNGQGD